MNRPWSAAHTGRDFAIIWNVCFQFTVAKSPIWLVTIRVIKTIWYYFKESISRKPSMDIALVKRKLIFNVRGVLLVKVNIFALRTIHFAYQRELVYCCFIGRLNRGSWLFRANPNVFSRIVAALRPSYPHDEHSTSTFSLHLLALNMWFSKCWFCFAWSIYIRLSFLPAPAATQCKFA